MSNDKRVKNKNIRRGLFAVTLTTAVLTAGVSAEEANESETLVYVLDQVVITATRTEQNIKQTPATAEVITAEQIAEKGAVTLQQALENATSINLSKETHVRAQASIRGFDTRHTLILVDGKRRSTDGSENFTEMGRITLENVERIEIIRGPVSSLYGSDAMGGVINIITKQPQKSQLTLDMETRKYTEKSEGGNDWFVRYDAGKKDRFGWSVSYGENKVDPYAFDNGVTPGYYGYVRPFTLKSVLNVGQDGKLTLDYEHMEEKSNRKQDGGLLGLQFDDYDRTRTTWSLGYEDKRKSGDYQVRLYKSSYDTDFERRFTSDNSLYQFDLITRDSTIFEAKESWHLRDNHVVTAGGEYREEFFKGTRFNTGKGAYTITREGINRTNNEGAVKYYGTYVQDEWKVNDRLLVIPSVRYDDSDAWESAVTPKIGATYKIHPDLRLKASAGLGFATPTIDQTYRNWQHNPWISSAKTGLTIVGNPNLKPEKSTTFEIGLEGEKGETSGKVMLFHHDIKDLIASYYTGEEIETGTTNSGERMYDRVQSYRNINKADIWGVELEVEQKINDSFKTNLNYTYLDAENSNSGARLADRPRHQMSAGLIYHDKAHGITGNLRGTMYVDTIASTANNTNKTYSVWNCTVNKELSDTATAYIGIDNIFDKYDIDLRLYGAVYKTGLKFKF